MQDKQVEKLKLLRKLSEEGYFGEKDAAKNALDRLLKKYGLSIEDLDAEETNYYKFKFKTPEEERLLMQVGYKVTNSKHAVYSLKTPKGNTRKNILVIKCTAAEFAEISLLFDFYKEVWLKEQNLFFDAFIQKHRLFGDNNESSDNQEHYDQETAYKIFSYMANMSDEEPVKRLEKGN